MAKIVITHEFNSVEEAIAALGKIAGLSPAAAPAAAPVVEKPPRKPRADAGQPRGPNARTVGAPPQEQSDNAATPPATQPPVVAPAAVEAPAAPQTPPPAATQAKEPAVVPSQEDVQAAVEKLYNAKDFDVTAQVLGRFGVKRGKDLLPEQRAEFIAKVDRVLKGEAI